MSPLSKPNWKCISLQSIIWHTKLRKLYQNFVKNYSLTHDRNLYISKIQEVYKIPRSIRKFFCKKYEAFQKLMHDYENLKGYKFLVILVLLTRPWVRVHFKWFIYRYFSNIFRMCSLKSSAPKKNAYFIYFSIFLNSCSDQLNLSSRNVSWIIWIFLIIIMQRNIMNIFVKHYMC